MASGLAHGLITERVANTDGVSTAFTNFGAVPDRKNYVRAIVISNSHATTAGTVDFRDGTGGAVLWTVPAPAASGAICCSADNPLFATSANTALAYDVSAAITTITISVSGFQAP